MNERQLEQLNELRERLTNSIGQYGYTEKYSIETEENRGESYATARVTIPISFYNEEFRTRKEKNIYIEFLIFEDRIEIVMNEDVYEPVDCCNFDEWIWRKMFFEK